MRMSQRETVQAKLYVGTEQVLSHLKSLHGIHGGFFTVQGRNGHKRRLDHTNGTKRVGVFWQITAKLVIAPSPFGPNPSPDPPLPPDPPPFPGPPFPNPVPPSPPIPPTPSPVPGPPITINTVAHHAGVSPANSIGSDQLDLPVSCPEAFLPHEHTP